MGIVSLDLFCEWRKRILDHDGFVDACLTQAVIAPVLVTAAQAAYSYPKLNERAKQVEAGQATASELCHDKRCRYMHCANMGLEFIKVAGLAVAGLRFGKMLAA